MQAIKVYMDRITWRCKCVQRVIRKYGKRTFGTRMHSIQGNSDSEFLKLFDCSKLPGLKPGMSEAQQRGVVIEHFRARVSAGWLKTAEHLTDQSLDFSEVSNQDLISRADAIVAGKNLTPGGVNIRFDDDGHINWTYRPKNDKEWALWLHRHSWWGILSQAYEHTGDRRYAKVVASQLRDWIQRHPVSAIKDESHTPWRLMEVGLRIRTVWIPLFGTFYNAPEFDDRLKLGLLRSIWEHGQFLSMFKTNRNHLLRESNGLGFIATWFPEFQQSPAWLALALERLEAELEVQINDDGSHIEVSTGYQWLVVDEFEQTYQFMRETNAQFKHQDITARLEGMYAFLAKVIRPDGTFPEINDGFTVWPRKRLLEAGHSLARSDFEFVGSGGELGHAPIETSAAFRDAGLFIMRSDWSSQALYLLFDAGPYGGPHGHEDKLSIEISAYGTKFVVDSGSYVYNPRDPARAYFVSSAGHNTVMVDGMSQVRRWKNAIHMHPTRARGDYACWHSADEFDYVMSEYKEEYGTFSLTRPSQPNLIDDVNHVRHVLFVKPDYWLIVDCLTSPNLHSYQFLYHAHPEVSARQLSPNHVCLEAPESRASLDLLTVGVAQIQARCVRGAGEPPFEGWFSTGYGHRDAADAVVFETPRMGSLILATLAYPASEAADRQRLACTIDTVDDGNGATFRVRHGKGTDYLVIRSDASESAASLDAVELHGRIGGVRLNPQGQLQSRFSWNG